VGMLVERLRTRGWRMTPQRRVVAEVLEGRHGHLTAEEVHALARERLPEVSLATVYNTLNELAVMGEVLAVSASEGPKRYDTNVSEPHQHLVCVRCQALVDVHPVGQDTLGLPDAERHGYELLDVEVVFKGLCAECRTAEPERAPKA